LKLHTSSTKGTLTEQELAGKHSKFVELNGIQVHYEFSKGKNNKTLVVLLHGFGANTFSFRHLLPELTKLGDVVSYDRPCFGLTVRPKQWSGINPYGYQAQILLLDEVIKHFGANKKIILLGHSAGAAIAADWALKNQDCMSALILEAPAILTLAPVNKFLQKLNKSKAMNRIGPRLVGNFKKAGMKILYRSWYDKSGITPEVLDGYLLPLEVKGWEAAFWEFVRHPDRSNVQDHLAKLKVPTLVIYGVHDQIIPPKDSMAVAKLIKKAKLIKVSDCGHLPHEETPKQFLAAVEDFISQL
jgi:pimeloyl-ACP methyl ester carboxylesterase